MSLDILNSRILKAIPLPCILLSTDAPFFTIKGVNTAYLNATNTIESELIGKELFKVFPDNPKDLYADGVLHLKQSLLTVISTKESHKMDTQKYDIPIRGTDQFELRYWQPENAPVIDEEGNVSFIIHTIVDVTEKTLLNLKLKQLGQFNEKSHSLLEGSQLPSEIGSWDFNVETDELSWSAEFYKICGFEPFTVVPSNELVFSIIHPEDKEKVIHAYKNAVEEGLPYRVEKRIIRPNGEIVRVLSTWIPFKNKDGKVTRITGLFQNISSAKQMEEMLRKTEKVLRERNEFIETILQEIPIGISVNRISDGKATILNNKFTEIYGWEDQDFVDIPTFFEKVYPDPNYRKAITERIIADINSGDAEKMQWEGIRITTNKGEARYVNAKNIPLADLDLMISTVIDVTKEKLQTEEISITKNNQAALIDSCVDMIWSLDTDLKIITANEAFKDRILGLTGIYIKEGDSLEGITEKYGEEHYENYVIHYKRALQGEAFSVKDHFFNKRTAREEYILKSFSPMFNDKHEIFGIACYSKNVTEETLNHISVRKAKNELQMMMDWSADLICTLDKDVNFVKVNAASKVITGYAPSELEGKCLLDFLIDEKEYQTKAAFESFKRDPNNNKHENIFLHKNGTKITLDWAGNWDEEQQLAFCIARDVTEKKKIELEMSLLINNTDEAFVLIDKNFEILTFNYQFSDYIKKNANIEIKKGVNIIDCQKEENKEPLNNVYLRVLEGNKESRNVNVKQLDGTKRTFLHNYKPALDKKGDIIGIFTTSIDVTETKTIENKLKESEEKYRQLFNSSPLPMFLYDVKEFKFIDVNECAIATYGYCREEFLSKGVKDLRLKEDLDSASKIMDEAVQMQKDEYRNFGVVRHVKKDGSIFLVEITAHHTNYQGKDCIISTSTDVTVREAALTKVKESAIRFEYATKATSDAIWEMDFVKNLNIWTEGFKTLFGFELELEGGNLAYLESRIDEEDRERLWKSFRAVISGESGDIWQEEFRLKKANDEYAIVVDRGIVIRDNNGKALKMVGAIQDITQKKEEEQRLRLFESVVEKTKDIVIITEAEPFEKPGPSIVYVNNAYTKTTGFKFEEVIGKTPRMLQGEKTDRIQTKLFGEAIRRWEPAEMTIINYKKNGEEMWMNISVTPISDEKGFFTHWVAIQRDVTKQKEEEERLKLLESVITNTNEAVLISEIVKDSEQGIKIVYANEAFTTMTGYSLKEICGKTPRMFIGALTDINEVQKLNNSRLKLEPIELTIINYKKNGDPFWCQMSMYPIALGKEEFTHFVSISRDISETKRWELEQRKAFEQQALFTSIVNSSDDGIISKTLDGEITSWNKGAEKIFGFTVEEVIGKNMSIIIPSEKYILEETEILNKIKTGLAIEHYETQRKRKDGQNIDVSITISPIFDGNRIVIGASKVTRDITERKKYEKELLLSNERYNLVSKATHDSIWDWNILTGEVTRTGDGFKTLFGYENDREQKYRLGWVKLIHPDDFHNVLDTHRKLLKNPNENYWEAQYRFMKADGNYAYVYDKAYIIRDAEGKALRMIGATQDITQLKEQINEVMRIQQNLDSLINNTNDSIWSIDRDFKIVSANNIYREAMLLHTGNSIVEGETAIVDAFGETAKSKWRKNYKRALADEKITFDETYINPITNESHYSIVSFAPIHNNENIVVGVACFSKDVTEIKRAALRLEELNDELQKKADELLTSNTELEQFAFIASHDLQEPLRMVTSFMSMLEKRYADVLDEKGLQYIGYAVDGARRMRQIILDLLEFSRVGRGEISKEDIDLNIEINEILELFQKNIEERNATINIQKLPIVFASRVQMRQVFQNLIGNALKYAKDNIDTKIDISVTEQPNFWQFKIEDNGIGISAEHFSKIFIIFQRLHNKDKYSGTGMGLAVTKKVIETLGGKIWIESEEGKGSTFYFTILKQ